VIATKKDFTKKIDETKSFDVCIGLTVNCPEESRLYLFDHMKKLAYKSEHFLFLFDKYEDEETKCDLVINGIALAETTNDYANAITCLSKTKTWKNKLFLLRECIKRGIVFAPETISILGLYDTITNLKEKDDEEFCKKIFVQELLNSSKPIIFKLALSRIYEENVSPEALELMNCIISLEKVLYRYPSLRKDIEAQNNK
jgi:hypothetical protein